MKTFNDWLLERMREKGMSQSELARASGIGRSTISLILSGHREIGQDTAIGLARGLKIPPEQVFRAAGLLPPEPTADPWVDEMAHKLRELSPGLRDLATRVIDSMLESEEAERRRRTNRNQKSAKI